MKTICQIVVASIYLLLWPLHAWGVVRREDRLRLRRPPNTSSYWVSRMAQPDTVSYFSEQSAESGGAKRVVTRLLRAVSRVFAPRRQHLPGNGSRAAERGKGIPDEIYTLW